MNNKWHVTETKYSKSQSIPMTSLRDSRYLIALANPVTTLLHV